MKKLTKIAAAVSVATIAGAAHGGVITSSMTLNQLLSAPSGAYTGSFAINPLLADNGLSGGTINSAHISAYGYSDTQVNQTGQTGYNEWVTSSYGYTFQNGTYSYSCGWWSTCYAPTYGYALYRNYESVSEYANNDTVVDTMVLHAGSGSSTGSVGFTSMGNNTNYNNSTRSNGSYGYDTITHHDHTTYDYHSGALSTSYGFDASELLALALSGAFDFTVGATIGNFHLTQIAITLDVDPAAVIVGAVPEPESAALMLAGFAALAAATRARRRS